jgi:hypothetical protein
MTDREESPHYWVRRRSNASHQKKTESMSQFKPTLKGRSPRRTHISLGSAFILLPIAAACSAEGEPTPAWPGPESSTGASSSAGTSATATATSGGTGVTGTTTLAPISGETSTAASSATVSTTAPVASSTEVQTSEPHPILEAEPVTQAKLLTRAEYRNTVAALLQADASELVLPEDTLIAGFATVGSKVITVNEVAAEDYEKASQALTAAVFSDDQRWQALVGCEPQADLSDACVDTYVRDFGRRAFRRALTEEEVETWVGLARTAATSGDEPNAALGLAAATAGMLQSPNFLYRVESATPDLTLGRIKFDGQSMATRLAYLLTGSGPDDALLDSAAEGALDTEEGVRQAATDLASRPGAIQHMVEFFAELTQVDMAKNVERNEEQFPDLDEELRASMVQETRQWLEQVVLAPGADFREFFTSPTTFVDQRLAEFYGLSNAQDDGFSEVQLGAQTGRAGILGKAGFLMAHSSADSSNPTRRGNYIVKNFTCIDIPLPKDIMITFPEQEEGEGPKTTRQLFETHAIDATCVTCHSIMDPFGFALEHFDPVGQYRETENGLPIDAEATFQGVTFDGALEAGQALFDNEKTTGCFVKNFYRYANGTEDGLTDSELITNIANDLAQNGYVWRDMLVEFATSDAFTSLAASVGIPKAAEETTAP